MFDAIDFHEMCKLFASKLRADVQCTGNPYLISRPARMYVNENEVMPIFV